MAEVVFFRCIIRVAGVSSLSLDTLLFNHGVMISSIFVSVSMGARIDYSHMYNIRVTLSSGPNSRACTPSYSNCQLPYSNGLTLICALSEFLARIGVPLEGIWTLSIL